MSHATAIFDKSSEMAGVNTIPMHKDRGTTEESRVSGAIRVVVADGTRMGSQLISDALRDDSRFAVVGVCTTSQEVFESVAACAPDVVVVSMNLEEQPLKGFDVAKQLRSTHSATKVILLLDSHKRDLVVRAFGSGARGVFCRAKSIEALRKSICIVDAGQVWASSEELHFVLESLAENAPSRLVDARGTVLLSKREQDVVRCVTEGLTNREIAQRLKLSEHTVKNYIFRIFDKLGVSTRVEMVLYAFSQRTPMQHQGSSQDLAGKQMPEIERNRRRAEEGVGVAQLKLAEMYQEGRGVAQDKLVSYMWLLIAESTARDLCNRAQRALATVNGEFSRQDTEAALRMAAEWLEQHGYRVAPSGQGAKAAD
jgi:two-component system, NarL family, nitrate/nitrite response regulator NarL